MTGLIKNKYCALKDLANESAVEQFFTIRLLKDFKFHDSEILTKTSIKELVIGKGSKKETYKPDYAIRVKHETRLLIDAKDPQENVDDYIYQISGYALTVNQEYDDDEKPVRFCILTNGKITKVYHWARNKPLLELEFPDFVDGNPKFEQLKALLDRKNLVATPKQTKLIEETFVFEELPVEKLDSVFRACHDLIWKKDKKKPTTAFYEFCKLFYVKLEEDKRIHALGRPPTR